MAQMCFSLPKENQGLGSGSRVVWQGLRASTGEGAAGQRVGTHRGAVLRQRAHEVRSRAQAQSESWPQSSDLTLVCFWLLCPEKWAWVCLPGLCAGKGSHVRIVVCDHRLNMWLLKYGKAVPISSHCRFGA